VYRNLSGVDCWGITGPPLDCAELASEFVENVPISRAIGALELSITLIDAAEDCVNNDGRACGASLLKGLTDILSGVPALGMGPGWKLAYDTIAGVIRASASIFNCVANVLDKGGEWVANC